MIESQDFDRRISTYHINLREIATYLGLSPKEIRNSSLEPISTHTYVFGEVMGYKNLRHYDVGDEYRVNGAKVINSVIDRQT